jgi:hypothetical protein
MDKFSANASLQQMILSPKTTPVRYFELEQKTMLIFRYFLHRAAHKI